MIGDDCTYWKNFEGVFIKSETFHPTAVFQGDQNLVHCGIGEYGVKVAMTSSGDGVHKTMRFRYSSSMNRGDEIAFILIEV